MSIILFLLLCIVNTEAFYLARGSGHNTKFAEIITDPISGPYHIYLLDDHMKHICSIGARNSEILFTDEVCTDVTIRLGSHWVYRIDHSKHPYGTITVKILMSDGTSASEEIPGICPGTDITNKCLEWRHVGSNMTHSRRNQRESVLPQVAMIIFVFAVLGLIVFR